MRRRGELIAIGKSQANINLRMGQRLLAEKLCEERSKERVVGNSMKELKAEHLVADAQVLRLGEPATGQIVSNAVFDCSVLLQPSRGLRDPKEFLPNGCQQRRRYEL